MKKVKLTPDLLIEFVKYINHCLEFALFGESVTFNKLIECNLNKTKHKLAKVALKFQFGALKTSSIRLELDEVYTLSFVFKWIEPTAYLQYTAYKIIDGL